MTRSTGVEITTSTLHSSAPPAVPGAATVFMAGTTERGPLDEAVLVESLDDYVSVFGNRITGGTLHDAAIGLFRSGVKRVVVGRAAGAGAAAASITLKDKSTAPGLNTLTITASSKGAWGNDLKVEVKAGSKANTFRIVVTRDDVVLVDRNNLASPAEAVTAFSNNRWVRAVNADSATAAPNNIPKVAAAASMTGGDDDLDAITDETEVIAALDLFDEDYGPGVVIIPNYDAEDITTGLRAHCAAADSYRIGLVSPPQGLDLDEAIAAGEGLLDVGGEWVGTVWPWVGYRESSEVTRWVDPVVAAAACRAMAHADGAWKAPAASPYNVLTFFSAVERKITTADVKALARAGVNAIKRVSGNLRLRAWFPQVYEENADYPTLAIRDLLNVISYDIGRLLDDNASWGTIPNQKVSQVLAVQAATTYLESLRRAGALYERFEGNVMVDPGYIVTASNDPVYLDRQELHLNIGVRFAPHAALITVSIVKVGPGTPL